MTLNMVATNYNSLDNCNEKTLVRNAISGCTDSLETLFKQSAERIRYFIIKKVGASDIVEDLMQDTFLQAFTNIHKFRNESKFSTWITGIALNIIRNYFNRSAQFHYTMVDDSCIENLASSLDPEKEVILNQFIDKALQVLDDQPEEVREFCLLIIRDELPYKEISQHCEISIAYVKTRICRIRKALRESLGIDIDFEN